VPYTLRILLCVGNGHKKFWKLEFVISKMRVSVHVMHYLNFVMLAPRVSESFVIEPSVKC